MTPLEWVVAVLGVLVVLDVLLVLAVAGYVRRERRRLARRRRADVASAELLNFDDVDFDWPRRDAA